MMQIYLSYIRNYDDAMKLYWKLHADKNFAARVEVPSAILLFIWRWCLIKQPTGSQSGLGR